MSMTKVPNGPLVAIILAGGDSSRFGRLGDLLHKALLPVTADQTLLSRNLDYLHESGITDVVISTSPKSFPVIESFVERYTAVAPVSFRPQVISNPLHEMGSLAALGHIVSGHPGSKYVMSFADIFFGSNPYLPITSLVNDAENFVAGFPSPTASDWARGGLMRVRSGVCERMFLRPEECQHYTPQEMNTWSGITVFSASVVDDLKDFLHMNYSSIEEDFINFCLDRGRGFAVYEVDRFINVNCYADYLEVLCGCFEDTGKKE
jgi:NDP-sugar pyrophosphorylase family protein